MISTADFRNGLIVDMEGDLLEIVDFQHVKPGKGGAFVRTRFKNILTGRVLEKTFRSGEKFEEARVEDQQWQYLYHDGDLYHFMDNGTFEQLELGPDVVGTATQWIKENTNCTLSFYKGRVIAVEAPNFVELTITQADPGVQGDRATGGTKPATLETGAVVQVPLFVSEGEVIKVDTRTGDYITRVG
jgi:elongation factor P